VHVHEEVLKTANRVAGRDGVFELRQVVSELKHLKETTVRTHIVSRCCVNAPKHHPHKWEYFRRLDRGKYQVLPKYRQRPTSPMPETGTGTAVVTRGRQLRSTIHATVEKDGEFYVVECLELPVVTQGKSLDEAVQNLHEALRLHLEDEDLAALGLRSDPRVEIIYDMVLPCPA